MQSFISAANSDGKITSLTAEGFTIYSLRIHYYIVNSLTRYYILLNGVQFDKI